MRFALLSFILLMTACTSTGRPSPKPTFKPSSTAAPTQTPLPAEVTIQGIACPEDFREEDRIDEDVAININGVLTLTLGSTPSIPCGWQAAEVSDSAVIHQVDRQSEWPAEGVTPMPGAPGTEIWTFEALQAGESLISLPCTCLGEEGTGEELAGTLIVSVTVK